MKIYIDEDLPESCLKCRFLVHCDECEGHENYCPFIGAVGYDLSDNLITGAPVTPTWERHEECPLVQMPHGEWIEIPTEYGSTYLGCSNCKWENEHWQTQWVACPKCGASMKKESDGK